MCAVDALDRLLAHRVPAEPDDKSSVLAVAQLLGDNPRLEPELVEHVARARVTQLIEVEPITLINGDPLAQVAAGG